MASAIPGTADIVVLCMIPEVELRALRKEFRRLGARHLGDIHTEQKEERYLLTTARAGDLDIVIACLGSQSNIDSAIITLSMLYRYSPRFIFLFGIAGSMRITKYGKGSVVIGSDIIFRKITKVTGDGQYLFEMPPISITPDAQIIAREFMTEHVHGTQIQNPAGNASFKVFHEKILSWDLVLDSEQVRERLLGEVDRQVAVVEMEAAGFFKAITHYRNYYISKPWENRTSKSGDVAGLVIRGVSDDAATKAHTDLDPTNWRDMAADNAAFILVSLIETLDEEGLSDQKGLPPVEVFPNRKPRRRRRK